MKSVLLSIQPKWCELIASGKKTIEVRKTRPKLKTPFKCYIYCTNWKDNTYWKSHYKDKLGKVIGEFVCNIIMDARDMGGDEFYKKSCLTYEDWRKYTDDTKNIIWLWHISDLVIYDEPRELGEYCTVDENAVKECKHRQRTGQPESCTQHGGWIKGSYFCMKTLEPEWCEKCIKKPLKRAPQSWCYVESGKY